MEYFIKKRNTIKVLQMLVYVITLIFICVIIAGVYLYKSEVSRISNSFYILDKSSGVVLNAVQSQYTPEDRYIEYKSHVRDFLMHFYAFDKLTFIDNVNYASNMMVSETFQKEITKYKEVNLLSTLTERDIVVTCQIDTLNYDVSKNPPGFFSLTQTNRTYKNSQKRTIKGIFSMQDLQSRSQENSHACLIKDYQVIVK